MDGFDDLFLNQTYEIVEFTFGDTRLSLKCSSAASTDYDLTGQVLWPAARILSDYIAANPSLLRGRGCACELGAGVGLVGVLANQHCPVVLTDHSEVVLSVLQENGAANQKQHECRAMLLEWQSDEDVSRVLGASPDGAGYDLLLGADVCYSQNAVPSLFSTAARLLRRTPSATFLLGYVSRAATLDRQVVQEAAAKGFAMREVPGTRQEVACATGWVYELTWPSSWTGAALLRSVGGTAVGAVNAAVPAWATRHASGGAQVAAAAALCVAVSVVLALYIRRQNHQR